MGVDITAYPRLTKADATASRYDAGVFMVIANDAFPGRVDPLEDGALYAFDETQAYEVFSGGYGRYNLWREQLAKFAGYPLTAINDAEDRYMHAGACWQGATGPFSELINFADNEGTIGPTACAKLSEDFKSHAERAAQESDVAWVRVYRHFMHGFAVAADGGAVEFS